MGANGKRVEKSQYFIDYIRTYIEQGGLYGCLSIDKNRERHFDYKIVAKKKKYFSNFFRPYPFEILPKITY